ncbi:hypothetical protein HS088_TW23G00198 [Tripterygium wilfordii]|uniref:Uncharacterized protein n=1 Tax=Tripterygium wilfordii TaxID=458696 RepID=A0A7J7BVA6_TRIWF|nr:uncharacterized protein LOC119993604 [Tripterygium wilfordii]KAF5725476.1 hypothetical protein HS088_TW23G00198 [Tripterygium wilfordii]
MVSRAQNLQMLSFHYSVSLHNNPPSLLVHRPLAFDGKASVFSHLIAHSSDAIHMRRRRKMAHSCAVYAVNERDSEQQFEVDPVKAREALQELDQQLQILSKKQVSPPKIRASDVKLTREEGTTQEMTLLSGSFQAYIAGALILFTIFYNVLFYTVIQPSIDGQEYSPDSVEETASPSPSSSLRVMKTNPRS